MVRLILLLQRIRDIIWTSSDDSIAKIIDGVVHTYQEGKVTITASQDNSSLLSHSNFMW